MVAGLERWLILMACVWLASCSQDQILSKVTWPEDRALAQQAISDLEAGNAVALAAMLPRDVQPQLSAAFPKMRAALPSKEPPQVRLVDGRFVAKTSNGTSVRQAYLAYEISGGGTYALAQVTVIRTGTIATIAQLSINRLPGPVASINRFTISGKSAAEYGFLVLPIMAVVVTIAAIVRIWRSRRFQKPWLWTIGCFVGFSIVSMNWTTGQMSFQPIYFQLLSAGFMRVGLIGPWIISFSIPAIALYVLIARRGAHQAAVFE